MIEVKEGTVTLNRIFKFFLKSFDLSNEHFPNGICNKCIKTLERPEKGEKNFVLSEPYDFSKVKVSILTRKQSFCVCNICEIARTTINRRTIKLARVNISSPGTIKIRKRCKAVIGPGLSHPCILTKRREFLTKELKKDCIVWLKSPPYLATAWVKKSGSVTLSWPYQVTPSDNIRNDPLIPAKLKTKIDIYCGFIEGDVEVDGDQQTPVTYRNNLNGIMTKAPGNSILSKRAFPVLFEDTRAIGFQITNLSRTDPPKYGCSIMLFNYPDHLLTGARPSSSPYTNIRFLDPPEFVTSRCLNNLQSVLSKQDLQITCEVTGFPRPNLICQLLSYTGLVLDTLPQDSSLQENITDLAFKAVPPEASFVSCRAFTDSDSEVKSSPIFVKHPPFAPSSFIIDSVNNTLVLTWTKIPKNATGTDFKSYQVEYFITKLGVANRTTITIQDDKSNSSDMKYYLVGLAKAQYFVTIYGINVYGKGSKLTQIAFLTSADKLISSPQTSSSLTYRHSTFCYWYIISSIIFYFLF